MPDGRPQCGRMTRVRFVRAVNLIISAVNNGHSKTAHPYLIVLD